MLLRTIVFSMLLAGISPALGATDSAESPPAEKQKIENLNEKLLDTNVYFLKLSRLIVPSVFKVLSTLMSPKMEDIVSAKVVEAIRVKTGKQQKEFAQDIGITEDELAKIEIAGTRDVDLLEKIWQQQTLSESEWGYIRQVAAKELIPEQQFALLNRIKIQVYNGVAQLLRHSKFLLQVQKDMEELSYEETMQEMQDNYEAIVDYGKRKQMLGDNDYITKKELTADLAQTVHTYIKNASESYAHAANQFFQTKFKAKSVTKEGQPQE